MPLVTSELTGLQRGGTPSKPLGEVEKYAMPVEGFTRQIVIISCDQNIILVLDRSGGTGAPDQVDKKFARELAAVFLGRGASLVYQRTSPACFRAATRPRHVVDLVLYFSLTEVFFSNREAVLLCFFTTVSRLFGIWDVKSPVPEGLRDVIICAFFLRSFEVCRDTIVRTSNVPK